MKCTSAPGHSSATLIASQSSASTTSNLSSSSYSHHIPLLHSRHRRRQRPPTAPSSLRAAHLRRDERATGGVAFDAVLPVGFGPLVGTAVLAEERFRASHVVGAGAGARADVRSLARWARA